jgi:hypothetical protein
LRRPNQKELVGASVEVADDSASVGEADILQSLQPESGAHNDALSLILAGQNLAERGEHTAEKPLGASRCAQKTQRKKCQNPD